MVIGRHGKGGIDIKMETLNIIIITLLIYSLITTIAYIISGENENVLIAFGLGIVGLFLLGICELIRKIRKLFKYRIGKRSIFEEDTIGGDWIKCKTKHTDDILWMPDNYKLIKRYASKSEWKGLPDFSKEFIEKSKRNCDHCKYDKECLCDFPYDKVKCKHNGYGTVIEFDKFEKG